jgi:hypothetical protein
MSVLPEVNFILCPEYVVAHDSETRDRLDATTPVSGWPAKTNNTAIRPERPGGAPNAIGCVPGQLVASALLRGLRGR